MLIIGKVAIGILILGILVLIHELGHFLAAKACKIRVLAFSIGFGKVLLHKQVGETDYRISAIPFGGYVKMAGEYAEEGQEKHVPGPDEFTSKPVWQRAIVAVAGPLANFVAAVLMLWFMFMWGVEQPTYYDRAVVGGVADSSAAMEAGLQANDSILTMNGKPIQSWNDIEDRFAMLDKRYEITLLRAGEKKQITIETDQTRGDGYKLPPYGMVIPVPAVIGEVFPNSPAAKAGLKSGDTVRAIDGNPVAYWSQLSKLIQTGSNGHALEFTLARGSSVVTLMLSPRFDEKAKSWIVGIKPGWNQTRTIRFAPVPAWRKCMDKTENYTVMIFVYLKKLITKELSWTLMAGPVAIIPMSGYIAVKGISYLLNFMAMLGINLAVINLFPLIITDGGMLLFLAIEAIRRRPLSIKTQIVINNIGIALFISLFVLITFNDITNLPKYFKF